MVPAGLPFVNRNTTTRARKIAQVSSRTIVPMAPAHLPHLSSIHESTVQAQTTPRPTAIEPHVPSGLCGRKKLLTAATTTAATVLPTQTGLDIQ